MWEYQLIFNSISFVNTIFLIVGFNLITWFKHIFKCRCKIKWVNQIRVPPFSVRRPQCRKQTKQIFIQWLSKPLDIRNIHFVIWFHEWNIFILSLYLIYLTSALFSWFSHAFSMETKHLLFEYLGNFSLCHPTYDICKFLAL